MITPQEALKIAHKSDLKPDELACAEALIGYISTTVALQRRLGDDGADVTRFWIDCIVPTKCIYDYVLRAIEQAGWVCSTGHSGWDDDNGSASFVFDIPDADE